MEHESNTDFSSNNLILGSLSAEDRQRLASHLEPVEFEHGATLDDYDDEIRYLYFPDDAMISVVTSTLNGQTTEVGVIGSEGASGIEALLDGPRSLNRNMVQLPGAGHRVRTPVMKEEFLRGGSLQQMIFRVLRAFMGQISQTSLCNRLHTAEQRLAKWLLMSHDRSRRDVMPITQEFAAIMLGTNRVSVTLAAQHLQESGLIEYSRGKLAVVNRQKLETYACECYARISAEYARLRVEPPTAGA